MRTNAPTRPSRLYNGIGTYMRKSMATIFRIYTVYRPLKTFFAIGSILMLLGVALGARFLWFYAQGERGGHIQSLILAAVFLITGFHTWLIALLADLIAVNRRLTEDVLIRVKKLESPQRRPQPHRPIGTAAATATAAQQQSPSGSAAAPTSAAAAGAMPSGGNQYAVGLAARRRERVLAPATAAVTEAEVEEPEQAQSGGGGSGTRRRRRSRRCGRGEPARRSGSTYVDNGE